jgi:lipopolysaccharide transport system ATP-binding protein
MHSVSAASVVLEHVTKVYGTGAVDSESAGESAGAADGGIGPKAAVKDVSLRLDEGTRLGIIGRNGAGKTTLLQMIAGLADPTSGRIHVSGQVTAVMTIGLGLREALSGRENIYIDGQLNGKSRAEIDTVVDDIVKFADLGHFIEYPVRTYSTGMKARLAFSMISHLEPEILIIDEALGAGDAKFSVKAAAKIQEICSRGKIVIIVSHSMGSIRQMCNKCIWMDEGSVVRMGPPDEVIGAYLDTVHQEDEAALLAPFRRIVGARSHLPGWHIGWLEVGSDRGAKAMIETEKEAMVSAGLSLPGSAGAAELRFSVHRLDGLVLIDEIKPVGPLERIEQSREVAVRIEMSPVMLGPGVYRVGLRLLNGNAVAAERHTVFEVFTRRALIGGKPALFCPVRMQSQRRVKSDDNPEQRQRQNSGAGAGHWPCI